MISRKAMLIGFLLVATAAFAADIKTTSQSSPAAQAFSRLKSLAGTWQGETDMGKLQTTYEIVSGGSVLLERITGPHPTPMITAYYLNGDKLELTHYCELGNQPHMIARSINLDSGELDFAFAGASNLAGPNAQHMHSAKVRLVDNDHFTADWTLFENAKPAHTMSIEYVRVK
jgi:hypothetical protein